MRRLGLTLGPAIADWQTVKLALAYARAGYPVVIATSSASEAERIATAVREVDGAAVMWIDAVGQLHVVGSG